MSRTSVRHAIARFLSPENVSGLSEAFPGVPREILGENIQMAVPVGQETYSVLLVFLGQPDEEERIAMGAPYGAKRIIYPASLTLVFFSIQQDAIQAQDDADAVMEALVEQIRSDETLGTTNSTEPIFCAGEGSTRGDPDIRVQQELPFTLDDGATICLWYNVALTVVEMIQA